MLNVSISDIESVRQDDRKRIIFESNGRIFANQKLAKKIVGLGFRRFTVYLMSESDDEYDEYLFIVLHFPYYDKRRKRIVIEEIDCFIGHITGWEPSRVELSQAFTVCGRKNPLEFC